MSRDKSDGVKMNEKNLEKIRKIIIAILLTTIFLVPLIVSLKIVPIPESLQQLYNQEVSYDFFAYAKVQILKTGTILSFILVLFYQWNMRKKHATPQNKGIKILLLVFAVSIMISFLLSEHKQLAWIGMIERYEGTLTWLCYIGLTYITMTVVKTRRDINALVGSFVLSASIVSIIGAFQMLGMDFFKTDLGKLMMLGSRYEELFMQVNFNFEEGRVYSTLYNPNYVGSLVALSFPLTIYCVAATRQWWMKLGFTILIIPQMISLIGSDSTGGFVAVAMSILFMIIYALIKYRTNIKVYVGATTLFIIGIILLTQLSIFEPYMNKIAESLDVTDDTAFTTEFASVEYNHPAITYYLQNGEHITVEPLDGGLNVESEGEGEVIQDVENERIIYKIISDDYVKQVVYRYKTGLVRIYVKHSESEKKAESRFNFYYTGQFSVGTLPLDEDNYDAESIGWFKNEHFMSGRGYIWNRTIPMILDKPMVGYGSDTFTINYPQGDLIYKKQIFGNHAIIVDKPHNLYLNIVLNFGFVGLFFFLGITLYTFIKSQMDFLVIPILSYFVVGLVNDSVFFVTYMMFALFGILLTMLNLEKSKKTQI